MGWIRNRVRMDPELLPGSGTGSGSGSGINYFGSTTLPGRHVLYAYSSEPTLDMDLFCSPVPVRPSIDMLNLQDLALSRRFLFGNL